MKGVAGALQQDHGRQCQVKEGRQAEGAAGKAKGTVALKASPLRRGKLARDLNWVLLNGMDPALQLDLHWNEQGEVYLKDLVDNRIWNEEQYTLEEVMNLIADRGKYTERIMMRIVPKLGMIIWHQDFVPGENIGTGMRR